MRNVDGRAAIADRAETPLPAKRWRGRLRVASAGSLCSHFLPLRQEHGETLARAAGLDEFAHGQFMAAIAALVQSSHELRRAFGENDVAPDHHGVT